MKRIPVISDYVRRATGRILHVGCADSKEPIDGPLWLHGHIVRAAASSGAVIGIDIDEERVAGLRQRGYDVEVCSATDADRRFGRGHFDLVVLGEVIEHIPDQGVFLAACRNVLAPAGRLVVSTPNPCGIASTLGYWLSGKESWGYGHVLWHSPRTVTTLAETVGLRVVRTLHCTWGRRRWWAWPLALLELWPAMRPTIVYELVINGCGEK